ncbi:MAG: hypothetical protein ACLP29_03700 [Dissulfurispiraceae bacterium]|jgi:hypothetical protein
MVAKKIVIVVLVVGLMIGGAVAGYAMEQPHMYAAMEHLKAAKAELERAEHDKGGFRVKAIETINRAMEQVQRGIEAGNRGR